MTTAAAPSQCDAAFALHSSPIRKENTCPRRCFPGHVAIDRRGGSPSQASLTQNSADHPFDMDGNGKHGRLGPSSEVSKRHPSRRFQSAFRHRILRPEPHIVKRTQGTARYSAARPGSQRGSSAYDGNLTTDTENESSQSFPLQVSRRHKRWGQARLFSWVASA